MSHCGHHSLHLVKVIMPSFELNSAHSQSLSCHSKSRILIFLHMDISSPQCHFLPWGWWPSYLDCKPEMDGHCRSPDWTLMDAVGYPLDCKYPKYCFLTSSSCWAPQRVASVENALEYNKDFTKLPTSVVECHFTTLQTLEAMSLNLCGWCHKLSLDWCMELHCCVGCQTSVCLAGMIGILDVCGKDTIRHCLTLLLPSLSCHHHQWQTCITVRTFDQTGWILQQWCCFPLLLSYLTSCSSICASGAWCPCLLLQHTLRICCVRPRRETSRCYS